MQYRAGLAKVTSGSNRVISTGTDWTSISPGDIFLVKGNYVPYFISSTSVVSGNWEATLSTNYMQATHTGTQYAICQDFTDNLSLPLLAPGDIETASIFSRAMALIDSELTELGGGTGIQVQSFKSTVPSGSLTMAVTFPDGAFSNIPQLVMSLEIPSSSDRMYLVQPSGVTTSGCTAVFSNNIHTTGFKLHVYGKSD